MSPEPVPRDLVVTRQLVQSLPEAYVLYRFPFAVRQLRLCGCMPWMGRVAAYSTRSPAYSSGIGRLGQVGR